MKNKILILLLATITLASCFDLNKEGCPADMYLSFSVSDPHEPNDTYDSRLGNDVMLYIFKDHKLVAANQIPYAEISAGQQYVIRKTEKTSGNLDLVAWAIPAGCNPASIPHLSIGDLLGDIYRELEPTTRAEIDCHPADLELHVSRITTQEPIDKKTNHILKLNYSDCRIEVKVTDNSSALSLPGSNPKVSVHGTMTTMDMDKKGVGNPAVVCAALCSDNNVDYTTERFGVLPSADGQTVSVKIWNGPAELATLTVPESALPHGAVSGGLIIFEYTLNAPSFTLVVDGFRHNVVIIDDM